MSDENPRIEWVQKAGVKCLKFTFKNNLEEQDAINAIAKWRAAFRLKFNEKIILIWDCVEMRGYDIKARNLWQGALKEMKSHIESIWLITNSSLI